MSVFEFSDFRQFLRAWIASKPKGGRGEIRKIADAIGVNPAMVSQVLSGDKTLSLELAVELSDHLGLADREADYFLLLVELARAGSVKLRKRLQARVDEAQKKAQHLSQRVHKDKELSDETKSVYYSSWTYTGVRNLVAVPGFGDVDSLASRLQLPRAAVAKVVSFLLEHGLCRMEDGQLTYGPAWTHLSADSPLVTKHHHNWRLRGMVKMEDPTDENMFITSPMSLSVEAARQIRKMVPSWIEGVQKIAGPSPSEAVRCLNIDWFEY